MIVITLNHPSQYEFLKHVFESYARAGLPSEELPLAADVFLRLQKAQHVPMQQHLGDATIAEMGPSGVVLDFEGPKGVE